MNPLPPRTDDNYGNYIPTVNNGIRSLASSRGVRLIDLCDHLSDDNCLTWSSASLNIGDGVHYTQTVRGWIADQIGPLNTFMCAGLAVCTAGLLYLRALPAIRTASRPLYIRLGLIKA